MKTLYFNKRHFFIAIVLFIVLVLIALFVRDRFIRPIFGDFLVVIFMYHAVRAVLDVPKRLLCIALLLFSFSVEIGQYYDLVGMLGLRGNRVAEIIIGTGFSWIDMLAYSLGAGAVYLYETLSNGKKKTTVI